ncbi:MAG: DUF4831 family protein [Muribaculaceae bacterium]|nr:DUF4831 family protein [Muribaculaceae bacterium]
MKSILSSLILSALMLASVPAAAQTTTKLTASKANEYGLIYTLPLTGLEVTIAAEKTVSTPGEFCQYARKYLNADPILTPSVSWKITDAVIVPTAEADTGEQYLVTLKGGNGTYIMVSDQGFPLSINDDSYDAAVSQPQQPKAVKAVPTILETPEARQAVTPEMIQSRSSAKRAELAAAKIYELRTYRNEIISGQADAMPADGDAMKTALARIDRQEEALTAMFLGTVQTSVEVKTYSVEIPLEPAEAGRSVVARLSALQGLVSPEDLSGAPIYLTLTPTSTGTLPVNEKGEPKTFPKGGVAYRVPGTASAELTYDGRTLATASFDVAQYGVVFGVDPALFTSRKAPSYLHFQPLTGAIRELGTITE